jgi:hypothetical protein
MFETSGNSLISGVKHHIGQKTPFDCQPTGGFEICYPQEALKAAIEQIQLGLKSAASTAFLENPRCFHIGSMLAYIWVDSNKGGKFYGLLVGGDAGSVARATLAKVALLASADLSIGIKQVLSYGQCFSFCSKRQVFLLIQM